MLTTFLNFRKCGFSELVVRVEEKKSEPILAFREGRDFFFNSDRTDGLPENHSLAFAFNLLCAESIALVQPMERLRGVLCV